MAKDSPNCFTLDRQEVARAFSRAWAKTGNRMAARIAMMAMTTSSSMRVNADRVVRVCMDERSFPIGDRLENGFGWAARRGAAHNQFTSDRHGRYRGRRRRLR